MIITVNDRASYAVKSSRVFTDEGFLCVPGRVSRTGIQQYLARELNLDGDPNRIVNVYRPEDEVFKDESLSSFDGSDITIEHPDALVNSKNYSKTSVGVVRGVARRDGEFTVCDLVVKDQRAIDAISRGKCELSAGYTAVYDNVPGIAPDGTPYEFVQRDIKVNHVALVDRARAGNNARIFDHSQGGNHMPVMITNDTGRKIDVADPANAQVVADAFDRLTQRVTDAEAKADKAEAEKEAMEEELEAEKTKSNDAAIAERVAAIATVTAAAKRVVGDSFKCESMDTVEIMRTALAAKRPKLEWSDKSPAYVQAAFDMLTTADEPAQTTDTDAQLAKLAQDAAGVNQPAQPAAPVMSRAQEAILRQSGKAGV